MARVKIEDIIDHLDTEIRKALEATVKEAYPEVNVDSHKIFRIFKRKVSSKCNTWERVPDQYVERE